MAKHFFCLATAIVASALATMAAPRKSAISAEKIIGDGVKLPYDSAVEYLESTGSQWIELPFGFDRTDEVYARINCSGTGTYDYYIIAAYPWNQNNNRYAFGVHTQGSVRGIYCFGFGNMGTSGTLLAPYQVNDRRMHTWTYANNICTIPDLQISVNVSKIVFGSTSANIRLFYGYNGRTPAQIAEYKHTKNGVVVCDLIAVRLTNGDGQSVGAMYDRRGIGGINPDGSPRDDGFYFNRGTGAGFIIGPDKQ